MGELIFLAAGFISASLLGLIAVRLAWRRAVRLTEQRMSSEAMSDGHVLSLADMEGSLDRQSAEVERLQQDKAAHEENIRAYAAEIDSLNADLDNLHAHYEAARRDADEQRQRVAELEAAVADELHRQRELEPKLRELGDGIVRLASQFRRGSALTPYSPSPARMTQRRETPAPELPALQTLEASEENCQPVGPAEEDIVEYAGTAGQPEEHPVEEHVSEEHPQEEHSREERPLEERIRALQAGVATR